MINQNRNDLVLSSNWLIQAEWIRTLFYQIRAWIWKTIQFSSVVQSCLTLCNPMNCNTPGFPVHHQLPEFTQTHVHRVSDAIQPSHPLSSPSSPAPNPSQHQSLFQWVNSSHEVAKVLEKLLGAGKNDNKTSKELSSTFWWCLRESFI